MGGNDRISFSDGGWAREVVFAAIFVAPVVRAPFPGQATEKKTTTEKGTQFANVVFQFL